MHYTYSTISTLEVHYSKVQAIVQHMRVLYAKNLWLISDWDTEGQYVLTELLDNFPELSYDTVRLQLAFRTHFVKHLSTILFYQD